VSGAPRRFWPCHCKRASGRAKEPEKEGKREARETRARTVRASEHHGRSVSVRGRTWLTAGAAGKTSACGSRQWLPQADAQPMTARSDLTTDDVRTAEGQECERVDSPHTPSTTPLWVVPTAWRARTRGDARHRTPMPYDHVDIVTACVDPPPHGWVALV